jgi:sugar phosphate isomerase/epimerase
MEIGVLTAPFGDRDLPQIAEWAGSNGFKALEVSCGPGSRALDSVDIAREGPGEIPGLLKRNGLRISSLAFYSNPVDQDPDRRQKTLDYLRTTIDAAKALNVGVVCTLAGMPLPGKGKRKTIEEDLPGALGPVIDYAGSQGIKIALENWYATNIENLDQWSRIFEVLPQPNFGLNYDPSHLYWQGIDYLAAVEEFKGRIFHTHAKDVEIRDDRLRRLGSRSDGWWRYVIPGLGRIPWGEYLAALRRAGYNDVLSIEHEDDAVGREEGFVIGRRYLEQFLGPGQS